MLFLGTIVCGTSSKGPCSKHVLNSPPLKGSCWYWVAHYIANSVVLHLSWHNLNPIKTMLVSEQMNHPVAILLRSVTGWHRDPEIYVTDDFFGTHVYLTC